MNIRYSQLDAFLRCPNGYYRTYILSEKEDQKSSALEFGSAMHAAIRAHFEDEDPYAVFNLYWDSIRAKDLIYDRWSWQDLRDLANNKFILNFLKLHAKKFGRARSIELELSAPLGEHTLQGTYDLCGEYNGELTMVDWKTSATEYKASKIIKNPQLYIYSYLYRHNFGVLPKKVMYKVFVKTKGSIQTVSTDLTEGLFELQIQNISRIVKNMEALAKSGEWYSNYNCYCERCFK